MDNVFTAEAKTDEVYVRGLRHIVQTSLKGEGKNCGLLVEWVSLFCCRRFAKNIKF